MIDKIIENKELFQNMYQDIALLMASPDYELLPYNQRVLVSDQYIALQHLLMATDRLIELTQPKEVGIEDEE